jgi:hypothetical protein
MNVPINNTKRATRNPQQYRMIQKKAVAKQNWQFVL